MRGVTPSIYATLRPWICALPTSDLSPINVNTLRPDQAPLIAMLAPEQLSITTPVARPSATPWSASTSDCSEIASSSASTPRPDLAESSTIWVSLPNRSEDRTSELQHQMRISYAHFC